MQSENWKKVKELLDEALSLDTSARSAFLQQSGASEEIRAEVESLLGFEQESENLMHLSAVEFSKDFFDDNEDGLIGQTLGVYQIIGELGYGGMGAVYLAERTDGKFEQKVALKLLKREMNTSALRRRFQQEREILASLEHPNIARLLDAGTTDDKILFLAMEYVEGLPIDDYCNKHALDLNQRLDLFRKVCSAVNFAHINLVVHRDLKPSNILVNQEGIPKLLDFGISKILSAEFDLLDSATVTKLGVMTPSYASLEQLQSKSVTTATDIYCLGVILFELLCGHRPFESKENDLKEVYRAVLDNEPPLPSALIDTISRELDQITNAKTQVKADFDLDETLRDTTVANLEFDTKSNRIRRTIPSKANLNSQSLRGDLDNIVLKALRKEPERRYSYAENLAEDIRRHQRGLPVSARPNTFAYRAEKFVRRNRFAVGAAALLVIAVLAGVAATLWQANVARGERDRAQFEAKKSRKINDYILNVLNFSNPNWLSSNPKQNRDAKISDALDEALKNVEAELADEPEIQGEIMFTIGQTYVGQTNFDKAEPLLRQAIEKFAQVPDIPLTKSMQAKVMLGDSLRHKGKTEEAELLYSEAIEYFRLTAAKDKSLIKWLVIPLNNLGNVYITQGKYADAKRSIGEANDHLHEITGKDQYVIPLVLGNYGAPFFFTGDFETAQLYYSRAMEEFRKMGSDKKYETGQILTAIGRNYVFMNDYQMADKTLRESREILLNTVGEKNTYVMFNLYFAASNLYNQKRFSEAEVEVKNLIALQREFYPNGHLNVRNAQRLLGEIYTKTNRLKEGEENLREALEYVSKKVKEPSPHIAEAKTALAENLLSQQKYAEAAELLTAALDGYLKTSGAEHPFTKQCRELLDSIPK